MSPNLATAPDLTRTADPPPLPLVEWAVAELDAVPAAVGHCYRCGFATCLATLDDATCDLVDPVTLDRWLTFAASDAVYAVFGDLPRDVRRTARHALARQLGERIAEVYRY